jgi:hypothetical protein
MRALPAWRLVAFGALLPLPSFGQSVPTRTLAKPEAEFSEPFTLVAGVRELKDGRVVVVDPRDKIVEIVDFKAGKAEKVGREGAGPGEYSLPTAIFPLPGDSSAVLDALNRRILVVLPNGKPGGFIDVSPPAAGGRGLVMMGANVAAIDGRGRYYGQGGPFRFTADGPQPSDSLAIERWAAGAGRRDTLAMVAQPKGNTQMSGGPNNQQVRIGASNPFTARDVWAVAPDGRVAVLHPNDYHIDWIDAANKRTSSAPIKFDRLKVTEGHKQEWRDSRKNQLGIQMTVNNGKQSAQAVPMTNQPDPPDWPEFMPPFLGGAASFSTNGTLWVRRTGPAGMPPTFDLIDGSGRVTQKVVLSKDARLAGFGANGAVYVTRVDSDDLQYLQRFRLN